MKPGGNPERKFHVIVSFSMGAALLISHLCFLSGCSSGEKELYIVRPSQTALIRDVPFFPQLDYQCGPASLASVLNYYGDTVTPDEIAEAIYRQNIRGTLSLDMVLYARQRGFAAKWYEGSTDNIVRAVDSGRPLVVMVDLGFSLARVYHYMVITGYSFEGATTNTGTIPQKLISWDRFLSQWEKTHYWTLQIMPREAVISSRQS